jgi:predicted acetyltransferase
VSEIRVLSTEDFDAFIDITVNAYPGMKVVSEEKKEQYKQRMLKVHKEDPTVLFYGLFREGRLLGGMRLHDFTMNFLGARIAAGGVGEVAVDLVSKKEHVAKEMMEYFIQHYRERGAPLLLLYPFRPDFYKRMGFGYGTKMNRYRVKPSALPKGPSKAHVRYLDESDKQALLDCYTRVMSKTHGMIEKSPGELKRMMTRSGTQIVGCEIDGQILGYLVFSFTHGEEWLLNDIHVREFIYESQEALFELLTFLHAQADQIRHIVFDTQDEYFHYLPLDPRNASASLLWEVYHESNIQGVGIMYRVIDVPGMFDLLGERDFGGQNCRLKLTIEDSFLPENAGSVLLCFEDGRLQLADIEGYDVEVWMDVAEFSSLLVGAVNFRSIYKYGLVGISDPKYVGVVDKVFAVEDKPICTTPF